MSNKEVPLQGNAKYGGVSMIAIRTKDGLAIRVGSCANYQTARTEANALLAATSVYRCIHIRDKAGHRIATVNKTRIGDRQLG